MRLIELINYAGVLTIVIVAVAMVVFVRSLGRRDRTVLLSKALLVALFGLMGANATWRDVSSLKPDRSEEQEEARRRLAEQEARAEGRDEVASPNSRIADYMRFAEDSADDRLDVAGRKTEAQLAAEAATNRNTYAYGEDDVADLGGVSATEDPEYAYRRMGKVDREAGKRVESDATETVKEETAVDVGGRVLPEKDVYAATNIGRVLNDVALLVFWLIVLALILDYLWRYRRTFDAYCPLPLGLIFVDWLLWKKTRSCVVAEGTEGQVPAFLQSLLARGSGFIYMGDEAPFAEPTVPRLRFGRLPILRTRVETVRSSADWPGVEFGFETAWFGRGCYSLVGKGFAQSCLEEIVELMKLRRQTRAYCPRTLHLVWDFSTPPAPELLDELLFVCSDANIRVILFGAAPDDSLRDRVEEWHQRWPERRPYPAFWDKVSQGRAADRVCDVLEPVGVILTAWWMLLRHYASLLARHRLVARSVRVLSLLRLEPRALRRARLQPRLEERRRIASNRVRRALHDAGAETVTDQPAANP